MKEMFYIVIVILSFMVYYLYYQNTILKKQIKVCKESEKDTLGTLEYINKDLLQLKRSLSQQQGQGQGTPQSIQTPPQSIPQSPPQQSPPQQSTPQSPPQSPPTPPPTPQIIVTPPQSQEPLLQIIPKTQRQGLNIPVSMKA